MIITRNIGIWMNHSIAYIMEFTAGPITTITVESKIEGEEKNKSGIANNNSLSFYKEQNIQTAYFKRLGESIKGCKELVLFGPTYAKVKLYDFLKADDCFVGIKIGITKTDNMDELQLQEFVMDNFSRRGLLIA